MNVSKSKSVKKISGMMAASAIVIGSLGSVAAFAANGNDAVPKDVLLTAPETPASPKAVGGQTGDIEHVFSTYVEAGGYSKIFENEGWYNPTTKQMRTDHREYSADHKFLLHQSTYENGSGEVIIIMRDEDGQAVSGKITTTTIADYKSYYQSAPWSFESRIAQMEKPEWIHLGRVTSEDGKEREKIALNLAAESIIEYVDTETGLPVYGETYVEMNGQPTLFSSNTVAYDYLVDEGTIFSTDGVTLTAE